MTLERAWEVQGACIKKIQSQNGIHSTLNAINAKKTVLLCVACSFGRHWSRLWPMTVDTLTSLIRTRCSVRMECAISHSHTNQHITSTNTKCIWFSLLSPSNWRVFFDKLIRCIAVDGEIADCDWQLLRSVWFFHLSIRFRSIRLRFTVSVNVVCWCRLSKYNFF